MGRQGPFFVNPANPFASWGGVELEPGQKESVGSGTEPESRLGLGCLQERVEAGGGSGRQAQVRENLDDHRGIFDSREDGQRATAL